MTGTTIYSGRLICLLTLGSVCAGCGPSSSPTSDSLPPATGTSSQVAAAPADSPAGLLSDELLDEGWIALFDGETLFGWQPATQADWRVENGTIVVEAGEPGLLATTTSFAEYVLHAEFLCPPETNSGIFLATQLEPGDVTADCYELNIAGPDNPFPTGSLVQRQKGEPPAGQEAFNGEKWRTYDVQVQSGRIVVHLDGQQVLDYTDPMPLRRGRIGLQLNKGRIAFRNVRLRPLGLEEIFNGRDLSGWKSYPEMASKLTVTSDGQLNVQNGSGQLETEQSYGDFVLQLECVSHAPGLNSGIFFRCIPGEKMNGYESQIHNGFHDGDRTRPIDCGTGGIFRRVDARRVVADDLVWFHKTLVADGPHIAVWVNGYQVTDWTDTRPVDPNPRKGLRVEPGTIMIQGHDPTTNLSFRNLRAGELPPRQNDE
ncbi:MAG: 3-keto-disaccharide hydrolase [Pirellulaceae bacterium]